MKRLLFIIFLSVCIGHIAASDFTKLIQQYGDNGDFSRMDSVYSLASKQINYTNEPVSALEMNVTYATYLNSQREYDKAYQILKRAREEKGWTQAYVAELVDRDSRTIMNIENKGQYPSFDLFVKLITMFDVSVDQFIHADGGARSSSCRKHIDVLLNSMNEKELVVIEATAEGIKKARETEVPE